jgi:hypothetical protein
MYRPRKAERRIVMNTFAISFTKFAAKAAIKRSSGLVR